MKTPVSLTKEDKEKIKKDIEEFIKDKAIDINHFNYRKHIFREDYKNE